MSNTQQQPQQQQNRVFQFDAESMSSMVEIPLSLCVVMKNMIDVCATRGAFVSDEFEVLASVIKTLKTTLSNSAKKQMDRQKQQTDQPQSSDRQTTTQLEPKRVYIDSL